uniref:Uncharacterized protein n=1 Tax=viral metagenome TaxID=1070528 RepID=A0A6M3IH79_9ZZZZ
MRQPIKFKPDKGKVLDVKIVKTNKLSWVVDLLEHNEVVKRIKVSKKSRKLIYP